MKQIETKISPLIESQFPSFYQSEGTNFISFVKAYYEWLEQNHQLLQLEDTTNFNVGDTIQQAHVTGTIIAFVGSDLLVRVDDLETFKCFNICNELIPVTSSSGGNTYILRGGTSRRLGAIFLARNLLNIRDVDTTIDLFINHFKEKYLRNIEFDTQTDKRLLIKNALDLYRSKGTTRSIDLFFRLIYGTSAKVVFPSENNLFKLSEGVWVTPQYIEITSNSKTRAISLVGKQITGLYSNATAFVEKYVRRKIKNGFVDILYVTNIQGEFRNNEQLYVDVLYADSPKIVGSLNAVTVIQGSSDFNVGDIVQFNSTRGDYGLARVEATEDSTGLVDFIFVDGGYGYTISGNTSFDDDELAKRTQSIVSEKVITVSNVITSNAVTTFTVTSGGSGYTNGDIVTVPSAFINATGILTTNATGGVLSATITNTGSGFYQLNPSVSITNSTGGATGGSSATIVANTGYQNEYYRYFEPLTQLQATLEVSAITNATAFVQGSSVRIANAVTNSAFGVIQSISANQTAGTGNIVITFANASASAIIPSIVAGNSIFLTTNSSVNGVITVVSNTSADGYVMGIPTRGTLKLTSLSSSNVVVGDVIYQVDSRGIELANANISEITSIAGPTGTINFTELNGVLRRGLPLYFRSKSITSVVDEVTVEVGVHNISNAYTNNYSAGAFTRLSGTTGNVISVSQGFGASFRVGTITDTETIYINSDLLSANNEPPTGANQTFMSVQLSSDFYGFPKNPFGNSSAVILSCLNFDSFEIGTIGTLNQINPGVDYNVDPYVLAYQPYVIGFDLHDYNITIRNPTGNFRVGERIDQVSSSTTTYDLDVNQDLGFEVGQRVYQTNSTSNSASGIINSINPSLNIINVRDVTGLFVPTAGSNSSLIGVGAAQTSIVYNAATNNQLYPVGSQIKLGTSSKFVANASAVIVSNSTSNGFILLGANTTKYANNTKVLYYVPPANTAIGGLSNNTYYYTRYINSTAIQLADRTGTTINLSAVSATAQEHIIIKYNATGTIILNSNSTLANANGTMQARFTSGTVKTGDVIYLRSNLEVQANAVSFTNSTLTTAISNSTLASELSTAKAIVTFANTTLIKAKRTQFENKFVANSTITGSQSSASATIVGIAEDLDTLPIGLNAVIEANVVTANGAVTSLQIIDSGVGYRDGEDIIFLSEDESRAGVARANVSGTGTGSGYYKTSRGFLSAMSKIHDGDYYQEYSYEVLTRLPFDKYKDMFKKVMHTAGTRVFGGVDLEEYFQANVAYATSERTSKNILEFQFNALTNVVSNSIIFTNQVNSVISFANSAKVLYYTALGNSAINPLSNNEHYYVTQANSTSIKLVTNPRTITDSFNSNSDITTPNYIYVPRHNFKTGDYVRYNANGTANAVIGLIANNNYFVHVANASHIQLSRTSTAVYTDVSNSSVLANGSYTLPAGRGSPTGIYFKPDGTKMYIGQTSQNYINEYTLSTPWQVNTATFTSNSVLYYATNGPAALSTQGLTFKPDGTKFYITTTYGDQVHEFNIATPWQINTSSFNQSLDLVPAANSIIIANSAIDVTTDFITYPGANSIFANATTIIMSTTSPGQSTPSSFANNILLIVRYANSSGFAVSTSTSGANVNFTTAGVGNYRLKQSIQTWFEVAFKPDGTKMYIARNGSVVNEYTLSTPWDISTATLSVSKVSIGPGFSTQGMTFVDQGKKLYITGAAGAAGLNGFDLSIPYDLNTVVKDAYSKSGIPANTFALAVKPDLTRFYVADNFANSIIEYDWFTSLPNKDETHSLSINPINIQSRSLDNTGHYISLANEN